MAKNNLSPIVTQLVAPIGVWTNGEQISYYNRKDPNYFEPITRVCFILAISNEFCRHPLHFWLSNQRRISVVCVHSFGGTMLVRNNETGTISTMDQRWSARFQLSPNSYQGHSKQKHKCATRQQMPTGMYFHNCFRRHSDESNCIAWYLLELHDIFWCMDWNGRNKFRKDICRVYCQPQSQKNSDSP